MQQLSSTHSRAPCSLNNVQGFPARTDNTLKSVQSSTSARVRKKTCLYRISGAYEDTNTEEWSVSGAGVTAFSLQVQNGRMDETQDYRVVRTCQTVCQYSQRLLGHAVAVGKRAPVVKCCRRQVRGSSTSLITIDADVIDHQPPFTLFWGRSETPSLQLMTTDLAHSGRRHASRDGIGYGTCPPHVEDMYGCQMRERLSLGC